MTKKILVGIRMGARMNKLFSSEAKRLEISKSELIRGILLNYMNMKTDPKGTTKEEWKRLKSFMDTLR